MDMEKDVVLVSYSTIRDAWKGGMGAASGAAMQALAGDPPESQAALLVAFGQALRAIEAVDRGDSVMASPDHRLGSLLQSFLVERAIAERPDNIEPLQGGLFEVKFDQHDFAGWIGQFFTWYKRLSSHAWVDANEKPEPLNRNNFRMAVFGDWGTGCYGAPACRESIEKYRGNYHIVLHLGDVYYSGTDGEIKDRFLKHWPRRTGAINRAINGNHEMYTGGEAYFNAINSPLFAQAASYFAFENDYWILAGLDSAYKDKTLAGRQLEWLSSIIKEAANRKILLFSHHQPFSLLNKFETSELSTRLQEFLAAGKIFAWYWGHEHRCVIYEQRSDWGMYGRCIGHGGYPHFNDHFGSLPPLKQYLWRKLVGKGAIPGCLVLDGQNPYVEGHEKDYAPHGYVALKFDGARLHETFYAPDGIRLNEFELT
ncbi:MAG TPA: metallophosphoesterase [Acidobacteriota bacterium]|jgi:hypothetical protein